MELENMELLRKQHEYRKFYKEINMARKQFKPIRHFKKLLNGRKDNKCVTFTTTNSNQILKGKT